MNITKTRIKIGASKLGNINNIVAFLTDLENTYNSLYAFEVLVDTLASTRQRQAKNNARGFEIFRQASYCLRIAFDKPHWCNT